MINALGLRFFPALCTPVLRRRGFARLCTGSLHPTEPLLVTMTGDRMHFFDTRSGSSLAELSSGVPYPNCRFDQSGERLVSATVRTLEFRHAAPDASRISQLGVPAFLRSSTSGETD